MSSESLAHTRRALHAVAELLIAGPQYEQHGDIRLAVTQGGFAGITGTGAALDGTALVTAVGRHELRGTLRQLAAAAAIPPRRLTDVYSGGPDFRDDEPLDVDPADTATLLQAFADGDAALRALAADEVPILWPEHFDVGISVNEVNYGVSPGDHAVPVPYAYVGPWSVPSGDFWNQSFGAARPVSDLGRMAGILSFFEQGRRVLGK